MKTKILSSVIVLFLLSFAVQSQSYWNERRHNDNQKERIRQGWRSGELTPREFKHLRKEQKRLHRAEKRMLRDGRLGPGERHKLNKMKKQNSRDICRKKHNGQSRRFK